MYKDVELERLKTNVNKMIELNMKSSVITNILSFQPESLEDFNIMIEDDICDFVKTTSR